MVDRNHPSNDCRSNNKKPSVFVLSQYSNDERNKKREHSNTLIPTKYARLEKHNVTNIHTTEKCHDGLDERKVECVLDDEVFYVLEHGCVENFFEFCK